MASECWRGWVCVRVELREQAIFTPGYDQTYGRRGGFRWFWSNVERVAREVVWPADGYGCEDARRSACSDERQSVRRSARCASSTQTKVGPSFSWLFQVWWPSWCCSLSIGD